MAEPQAVLTPITEAAIFLVLTVADDDVVRELLPDVSGLRRSVGFRVPEAELTCVTGIGARLWARLFGPQRPKGLHPFRELRGPRHTAPATPGDLLFHIRAARFDLCFELAERLMNRLGSAVEAVDEVHGFRSFDLRDVLGFVDGTENPEGAAAGEAVLVGEEDAAFAGGSYVVVQKYLHDLPAWDALPVERQEAAIGRTKLNDLELADQAPDSHVALNQIIGPDGEERQIMRFNMPFGRVGVGEYGTYFIGYVADPDVIEQMLEHMFIGNPPGTTDRILDFSTAVTGGLFFVPSADFMDDPPEPPSAPPGDGSLRIGGRRPYA
jgi:putative iron-dependent peroxidase